MCLNSPRFAPWRRMGLTTRNGKLSYDSTLDQRQPSPSRVSQGGTSFSSFFNRATSASRPQIHEQVGDNEEKKKKTKSVRGSNQLRIIDPGVSAGVYTPTGGINTTY